MSQNFKFLSSHRRPETKFEHAQVYQRASALTDSINSFQGTIITVYEVEPQKTVNKEIVKWTQWFSEVIKEFSQNFRENTKNGRVGNMESNVALLR